MATPVFVAIYLTERSKKALLEAVKPIHRKVFAEHLTVAFKPNDMTMDFLKGKLGTMALITVDGIAGDENGQAVHVQEQNLRLDKGIAHITISCADGIAPKYSMELLERGYTILKNPITLWGTYEPARSKS